MHLPTPHISVVAAVDRAGDAYITGSTISTNFPTQNPFQDHNAGGYDVFVTKLNPSGNALVYSTYLGGSNSDQSASIALTDREDNAYITGTTNSSDFPTKNPLQAANANNGKDRAFVTKLTKG